MTYHTLFVDLSDIGVLTVSLNRPDVRNAFNAELIDELDQVFQIEVIKKEVRVVVLRGEGKCFSAGGDLNWMKKAVEYDYSRNFKDTKKLASMFNRMNECKKPLIGAVHGAAIGGGVGLVSVCDIVVAEKETVFSLSEVRLGIVPACIGPFVVGKIGGSHARHLFMSAERFKAPHAKEIGLVHEVLEGEAAVSERVSGIVQNILQCGPNAVSVAKKLVLDLSVPERRAILSDPLDHVAQMLAEIRVSDEGQEGVRAFLEKRKPKWSV